MYYMHDLPKYARMKAKMEFAAHCAINMIQNTNRTVTREDIKRITYAWHLTIYPNVSKKMAEMGSRKCVTETDLFFVVGTENNNCKVMWGARSASGDPYRRGYSNPSDYFFVSTSGIGSALTGANSSIFCNVTGHPGRIKTEIAPTTLYKGFSIKAGEKKVIIEIRYFIWNDSDLSPREEFGFWVLTPKYTCIVSSGRSFFTTVVIFTPKPGLFSETPPQ
jgi:hypothetical protein